MWQLLVDLLLLAEKEKRLCEEMSPGGMKKEVCPENPDPSPGNPDTGSFYYNPNGCRLSFAFIMMCKSYVFDNES